MTICHGDARGCEILCGQGEGGGSEEDVLKLDDGRGGGILGVGDGSCRVLFFQSWMDGGCPLKNACAVPTGPCEVVVVETS